VLQRGQPAAQMLARPGHASRRRSVRWPARRHRKHSEALDAERQALWVEGR
jgi:hypothetical protein